MITLTTDFGYRDPFVGMMKGVILGISPGAIITDITHGISPQNVMEAALYIGESYRYFPKGTIHVVVVDPGVGSGRRPLLVRAGGHFFVGPDNGVFTRVLDEAGSEARHITREDLFIISPGRTFDGRDVFAPVAAWLLNGGRADELGPAVADFKALEIPSPRMDGGKVEGQILHIDAFGNAISNIGAADVDSLGAARDGLEALCGGRAMDVVEHYAAVREGGFGALVNASGMLEVFLFMGSAAAQAGIAVGDPLAVAPRSRTPAA